MRKPLVLLAVCAATVGLASPSFAAAKAAPACNLVTDPAGDATGFVVTGTPLPNDPQLDILGGDIASDKKLLTGVIRLAAVGDDQTSPLGRTYYVNFTINGTKVFLDAVIDNAGAVTYNAGDFTGTNAGRKTLGPVSGVMDTAKKEIRITAPVNTWPDAAKPGVAIAGLDLLGQRYFGTPTTGGATPTADEATSAATYKAGSPSCVVPGK
jgi:hypothetical protein